MDMMKDLSRRCFLRASAALIACLTPAARLFAVPVERVINVTLSQAHKGTLEIDTMLLDSFGKLPDNIRQFYFDARAVFAADAKADFTDPKIIQAATKHGMALMGGPMLGDLKSDGVTIWLRPAKVQDLTVKVSEQGKSDGKTFHVAAAKPGIESRIRIDGLSPRTKYAYSVHVAGNRVAGGMFKTAPKDNDKCDFRVAFGTCFHKIGLHNPNLMREVLKREPSAMMIYGDIAVDDRNNEINMHRADYQLRDVSKAWRDLAANVPLYTSWDDHDYFDNDLSGIPRRFNAADRDAVRAVWHQNWNNPPADDGRVGIYHSTRMGPIELIMLDTRSCRDGGRRTEHGAYLGKAQMDWLKNTLRDSTAPFKVITSGTMWSDYVSNGKDSWGTWDTKGRDEVFDFIEQENIAGVLLLSGDRHGARAFKIPRENSYDLLEFEPATLGGVPGPGAMVKNCPEQLFGYHGNGFIAFGEFTFNTMPDTPTVTFRLIKETGDVLEEHAFSLNQLSN